MSSVTCARIAGPTGPAGLGPQPSSGRQARTEKSHDLRARIGLDPVAIMAAVKQILHGLPARLRKDGSIENFMKEARRSIGGEAVVAESVDELTLAAIAIIVHVFLADVYRLDLRPAQCA